MAVGTPYTGNVPIPTSDNSDIATVNDFQKCYLDSGTCAETGAFADATGLMYDDGTTVGGITLPTWITYTSSTTTT